MRSLLQNGRFLVTMFAYSLLGGVSFAIPGVQSEATPTPTSPYPNTQLAAYPELPNPNANWKVFSTMNLDTAQTSLTNTAFILAGVLTGLLMGFCLTTKARGGLHHKRVSKRAYVM